MFITNTYVYLLKQLKTTEMNKQTTLSNKVKTVKSKMVVNFKSKEEAENFALMWRSKTMRSCNVLSSSHHNEVHVFDLNQEELNWVQSLKH